MATRMQQRRGTAAQWISLNDGTGPILASGEIGFETDTGQFKIGDGINHWADLSYFKDMTDLGGSLDDYILLTAKGAASGVAELDASSNILAPVGIVFEGATSNAYETTLQVTDPTADRTITIPNATGTIVLADGSGNVTVSGNFSVLGTTTIIDSTILNVTTGFTFEGATADAFETILQVVDPTADRTISLPDASGAVVLDGNTQTLSNKSISLASNTITGTLANFNTAVSDADLASLAGTETLTNKTLTQPKINEDVALIATATELNVLDGITSSTAELNILDGVTSTAAELNILDGVTATAAQINVLGSLTASATELNILDGVVATTAELNYVNGVTSAIQSQLNNKQAVVANVSDTEIGYLDGVTSAIQTQLNGKQATVANVSDVEIGYLDGVTSAIQTQMDAKSTASKTETLTNKTLTSPAINTPTGITKSDVGLANVDNTTDANKPVSTATQTALDLKETVANVALKAPLASPALTGVPTAPTAAAATNTTQVATTAYVRGEVAALVNSATSTLDTLGEIATALVNDANLSTTLTNSIALKAPLASPTFTGTVTIPAGASISGFAPLASPTFTGTNNVAALTASGLITASSSGVAFTDGTQTKEGVPSRTPIIQKTASYTLSALTERDSLIEVSSATGVTITIPTNTAVAYPVGTSIDILQTGAGQVTIAPVDGTVTVNSTPGLKLRTTWSSATLFKRAANTWVVFGDLTA